MKCKPLVCLVDEDPSALWIPSPLATYETAPPSSTPFLPPSPLPPSSPPPPPTTLPEPRSWHFRMHLQQYHEGTPT